MFPTVTPSVLGDEVGEDMNSVWDVAKSLRTGAGKGYGSLQGSPRRIDCAGADSVETNFDRFTGQENL